MKTRLHPSVLWAWGWLGVVASAQAQGILHFNNNFIPQGSQSKAFIFNPRGDGPIPKGEGRVQVLNAADGTTLTSNGEAGVGLTLDGLFYINTTVPGVPAGAPLTVVLRAWTQGNTYEDSLHRAQVQITIKALKAEVGPGNPLQDGSSFAGLSLMWRTPAGGFQLQTPTRSAAGTWSIPVALVAHNGPVFHSTHARLWSSTDLTHWTLVERRWFFAEPWGPWPVEVLTAPDTGQKQWFKLEW